jgi:DNA-binding NarL/FixJ family response regulator
MCNTVRDTGAFLRTQDCSGKKNVQAPNPTTVYLVCDHLLFRNGLRGLLRREGDVRVVGENPLTLDVADAIRETGAAVVLLAASAQERASGLAAQRLYRSLPDVAVIVVQMGNDYEDALAALRMGARGILDMNADATRLVSAIRHAITGEITITPKLATRLVADYAALTDGRRTTTRTAELSDREIDVMSLLAHGRTNQQIADQLVVSVHTVRAHLRSIMQKLGVKNRVQAARFALNSGIGGDVGGATAMQSRTAGR